ncbi:MAG: DNA internalization-related competence protein ComEC/Rec2 [Motiliproteus sp.]
MLRQRFRLLEIALRRVWRAPFEPRQSGTAWSTEDPSQHRVASSLIRALVIGDKRGLDDSMWRVLRDTGTAHLFVISGLHIAMVAAFCFAAVHWLGRLVPSASYRHRQISAAIAAIAGSGGYSLLAGFGLPTQRAWVMVCAVMISLIGWRSISVSQRLWLAATAVLLIEPLAVRQAGFWLSFGACAVLVMVVSGRVGPAEEKGFLTTAKSINTAKYLTKIGILVRAQLAITLGLTPWLLLLFAQWSVLSPLINLIAIPLVSLLLPLILIAVLLLFVWPSLGLWLLQWLGQLIERGWGLLAWLGALTEPWTINASVTMTAVLLALVGSLLLLLSRAISGRWLALLLWLPLIGSMVPDRDRDRDADSDKSVLSAILPVVKISANRPGSGGFRATVIDVGQGLSVLIETQHHRMLFDSGPSYRSGFSAAKTTIVPLLYARGIRRLDRLVISHADSDHSGGQQVVEQQIDVLTTLTGSPRIDANQRCQAGQQWRWDGVEFRFLHPSLRFISRSNNLTTPSENNLSCVLLIDNGQQRLLLTGDIEAGVERNLVKQYGAAIKSDVLLASHHGSRSSTSAEFLDQVDPEWVVISSGWRNRFNHPHPFVIRRVLASNAVVVNTAVEGAIIIDFSAEPEKPITLGSELKRGWGYWREPLLDRPTTH